MTTAQLIIRLDGTAILEIKNEDSSYFIKLLDCNTIAILDDSPLVCHLDFFEYSNPTEVISFNSIEDRDDFVASLLSAW